MNTLYITSLSHNDNKPFNDTIHEFPDILTLQTETCINTTKLITQRQVTFILLQSKKTIHREAYNITRAVQ